MALHKMGMVIGCLVAINGGVFGAYDAYAKDSTGYVDSSGREYLPLQAKEGQEAEVVKNTDGSEEISILEGGSLEVTQKPAPKPKEEAVKTDAAKEDTD